MLLYIDTQERYYHFQIISHYFSYIIVFSRANTCFVSDNQHIKRVDVVLTTLQCIVLPIVFTSIFVDKFVHYSLNSSVAAFEEEITDQLNFLEECLQHKSHQDCKSPFSVSRHPMVSGHLL